MSEKDNIEEITESLEDLRIEIESLKHRIKSLNSPSRRIDSSGIIPDAWPRGMKRKVAEAYIGGRGNLNVLRNHFGLKPTVQHHRNTTFSKDRIDAAWTRADQEGWPSPGEINHIIG